MPWGDRASARYSVELIEKKPSLGRWLVAIMDVTSGSTPDATAVFDLIITDTKTGSIVLREKAVGTGGEEALRLAEERLEQMNPIEFADAYSLPAPTD